MPDQQDLPSLSILGQLVETERTAMSAHAESLDTKASVVLGFAGVLVGLAAGAHSTLSENALFQAGMGLTVAAAVLATWAFVPRSFPVLELRPLRERYLIAPEAQTRLRLLDTQIEMTRQAADLVKRKGRRVQLSVTCLAGAVALIVIGTLTAGGQAHAGKPATPAGRGDRAHLTSCVVSRHSCATGL
jgi:hypothetical protein